MKPGIAIALFSILLFNQLSVRHTKSKSLNASSTSSRCFERLLMLRCTSFKPLELDIGR